MSMFTDRLRNDRNPFDNWDVREQAADKIEKLEAELRETLDLMHKARLSSIHHATDKAALHNRIEALEAALRAIADPDLLFDAHGKKKDAL